MLKLPTRTTLDPEERRLRDRLAQLNPDKIVGQLGSRIPDKSDLRDLLSPLAELADEVGCMGRDLQAIDYGIEMKAFQLRLSDEDVARLLIFCNDLRHYAGEVIEAAEVVARYMQFSYEEGHAVKVTAA